ncbi:MAG TPA: RNA polymerase sigma factor [Candidatus Binataceae bacterium]|nr:RNA polymerase sigma factor [Candidatus Binataceae bacterium]
MAQEPLSDATAKLLREAWYRYLDTIEPIRPSLYRYCRRVTGHIWDAEDLLQDTLLRGFGAIGRGEVISESAQVKSPRPYLFRIATNLWIDQVRRRELYPGEPDVPDSPDAADRSIETREAAVLMSIATPQERAAVVLKDVFDFTLEEIATMLSTTVGATKSAVHRGRASLEEKRQMRPAVHRAPSKELVDRFVAALNARDIEGVTNLLLENTTLDVYGIGSERGTGMSHYRVTFENAKGAPGRAEGVCYCGEWLILVWAGPAPKEVLINVERVEEEEGHIAHIRSYYFCPEIIAEIASEIGARAWVSPHGQNQPADTQSRIVASAILPWASG